MGPAVYRITFGLPGVRRVVAALFVFLAIIATACADEPPTGLSLSLDLAKERAYPGEKIPVTVTLRVSGVAVRNIGYPRIDTHGLSTSSMENQDQQQGAEAGGSTATYRFTGRVTAAKAGTFLVGPAQIECEVMETAKGSAAFFGESEPRRVTLSSSPLQLIILPLPAKGRPADFNGATGRFSVIMTARPTLVRVGDPVTVTTEIRGVGNLDNIPCPTFQPPGFRAYPATTRRHPDHLSCEHVLIPGLAGPTELRGPILSYFDPEEGMYHRASSPAVDIQVTPLPASSRPGTTLSVARQKWPISMSAAVVAAASFLMLFLAGLLVLRHRKRQPPPSIHTVPTKTPVPDWSATLHDLRRLLDAEDPLPFYTALYRAVQTLLTPCSAGEPATITRVPSPHEELPLLLHPHHARLVWLFAECDQVRFGRQNHSPAARREALAVLEELISIRDRQ